VTYPNNEVAAFIREHFIPVQFPIADRPDMAERFNAHWTPTIIILDGDGKEHHRSVGYLPPNDYLAMAALALGKMNFNRQRYDEAARWFDTVVQRYGDTASAPEALYWFGVARYKGHEDTNALIAAWQALNERYPTSEWNKKVSFIRDAA
jgi:tetratricopeptide (TPR) repeat protein